MTGCVTTPVYRIYPGEPRPRAEVVVLKQKHGTCVTHIDGQRLPAIFSPGMMGQTYELELLPGPHRLSVVYFADASVVGGAVVRSDGTVDVSFVAEAGRTYRVAAKSRTKVSFKPGVRDVTTWEAVVEEISR